MSKLKRGDLIQCSSAEHALKVADEIMIHEKRFSDFVFHHDGQTGYWVCVGSKDIPIISSIFAKISDLNFKVVRISKKVFKALKSINM